MTAMLTIRNDGPDDAIVVLGGNPNDPLASARRLGAGHEIRIASSVPVAFGCAKKLTREEYAAHHGITLTNDPNETQNFGGNRGQSSEEM